MTQCLHAAQAAREEALIRRRTEGVGTVLAASPEPPPCLRAVEAAVCAQPMGTGPAPVPLSPSAPAATVSVCHLLHDDSDSVEETVEAPLWSGHDGVRYGALVHCPGSLALGFPRCNMSLPAFLLFPSSHCLVFCLHTWGWLRQCAWPSSFMVTCALHLAIFVGLFPFNCTGRLAILDISRPLVPCSLTLAILDVKSLPCAGALGCPVPTRFTFFLSAPSISCYRAHDNSCRPFDGACLQPCSPPQASQIPPAVDEARTGSALLWGPCPSNLGGASGILSCPSHIGASEPCIRSTRIERALRASCAASFCCNCLHLGDCCYVRFACKLAGSAETPL